MIREELVSAIKALLQKKKQSGDMDSRKILKNFGLFLGLITIARNKPILADEIDFKFLLLEAHIKKVHENSHVELKFVVPFVAKVLEATKNSLVFQLRRGCKLYAGDYNINPFTLRVYRGCLYAPVVPLFAEIRPCNFLINLKIVLFAANWRNQSKC